MENRAGMVSNIRRFDLGRRLAAYAASAVLASLIYVVWLTVSTAFFGVGTTHHDWIFGFEFAVVFWLTSGFALALLLMIVPWAIVVWGRLEKRWDGRIYFPAVGALLVFTIGCAAASISPKPFFVEDQTFLEGAVITAQRQGLCLLFCGIAFGAGYWWLERQARATS
jgi:MFS family permease